MAYMKQKYGVSLCPLCSCHAPELAAGDLQNVVQHAFDTMVVQLRLHACMADLSEAQRASILFDYGRCRAHLVFHLQLKLAHWGQLPWLLFGLCHWDVDVARYCMRRALPLFDAGACSHWLAVTLLAVNSLGRAQVLQFMEGCSLSTLPFFADTRGAHAVCLCHREVG